MISAVFPRSNRPSRNRYLSSFNLPNRFNLDNLGWSSLVYPERHSISACMSEIRKCHSVYLTIWFKGLHPTFKFGITSKWGIQQAPSGIIQWFIEEGCAHAKLSTNGASYSGSKFTRRLPNYPMLSP